MSPHKFATGDRVVFQPGRLDANVRPGSYTVVYIIVRRMPATTTGCQYRVKSTFDEHERVVDEAQLRAA